MKYEYLCGCESDFFTMPANIIAVVQLDLCVQGLTEFSQIAECGKPVIAMRRIIRTPTWTVADQKAGILPPVGSKYLAGSAKREFTCLFHGKGNGTTSIVGHTDDGEVTGFHVQYCYPIESPEEKAARLRSEWCIKALGSASILSGMQEYELKRLGGYIGNIYDALLSGDLPVPVKDDK